MSAYTALHQQLSELADLAAAGSLMAWDMEVNLGSGSFERRASQSGSLAGLHHSIYLEKIPALLERAEKENGSNNELNLLNLIKIRQDLEKNQKLPAAFVREAAELGGNAMPVWTHAKKNNDFASFQPWLEKIIAIKLRESEYLGYSSDPYDPLLDTYEPGLTAKEFTGIFESFIPKLKILLDKVLQAEKPETNFLFQKIEKEKQLSWCMQILESLGFDKTIGRQDLSVHPFSISLAPEDVRITTVVNENDITAMLFSSIHETGHAMYEMGLPAAQYGLPGCSPCSLGIHESQSRLYENNLARSLEFWKYNFTGFAELFPDQLKQKSALDVFKAVNKVALTPIRIYSDELTYHFHIWLRFEAERELINRRLSVKDLPEFWNSKIKSYLGLEVESDSKGCLQDIHWVHGSFGYFPTYSLGSLYAAQLYTKAKQEIPGGDNELSAGNYTSLKNWLQEKIHSKGRLFTSAELCQQATSETLNPDHFLTYMREKLSLIYPDTF